jgi:hypothetical protein
LSRQKTKLCIALLPRHTIDVNLSFRVLDRGLMNPGPHIAAELPSLTIRASKLSAGQCLVNALPDRVLQLRLDGEQDSDTDLVAHPV